MLFLLFRIMFSVYGYFTTEYRGRELLPARAERLGTENRGKTAKTHEIMIL